MPLVDMPVDIARCEIDIEEMIEGRGYLEGVMEIPEVAFKEPTIVLDGTEALTERRGPSWDDRRGGPCLQGCKGLLEIGRPASIEQGGAMRS